MSAAGREPSTRDTVNGMPTPDSLVLDVWPDSIIG